MQDQRDLQACGSAEHDPFVAHQRAGQKERDLVLRRHLRKPKETHHGQVVHGGGSPQTGTYHFHLFYTKYFSFSSTRHFEGKK